MAIEARAKKKAAIKKPENIYNIVATSHERLASVFFRNLRRRSAYDYGQKRKRPHQALLGGDSI